MIQLKSAREIELMAQGGKILAATVEHLGGVVRAGLSTGELDQIAEDFIRCSSGSPIRWSVSLVRGACITR